MSNPEPINIQNKRRRQILREETSTESQPYIPPLTPTSEVPSPPEKKLHCSCCTFSQERVKVFLDLGGGVSLCDGCITLCNNILDEEGITTDAEAPKPKEGSFYHSYSHRTRYYCSFCRKEYDEVTRLIAMLNNLYICNRCIGECNALIAQMLPSISTEIKNEGERLEK